MYTAYIYIYIYIHTHKYDNVDMHRPSVFSSFYLVIGSGHATTWILFGEDLGFLDFFATPIPNLRELADR